MNSAALLARELFGLFVDDGSLALSVLVVVALAALTLAVMPDMRWIGASLLLFGCLVTLLANVLKAIRR